MALHPISQAGQALLAAQNRTALAADLATGRAQLLLALGAAFALGSAFWLFLQALSNLDAALACAGGV